MSLIPGLRSRRHQRAGARCRRSVAAAVLFVGLLALVQFSGPQASLNILWRFMVLSWDNPATQILDELILEKSSFFDALGDLLTVARLLARASHSALLLAAPGFATSEVLAGCICRSPPVA